MAKTEKKRKAGRPKEADPLAKMVATKISEGMYARLEAYATKEKRAASFVLRESLEQFLDRVAPVSK